MSSHIHRHIKLLSLTPAPYILISLLAVLQMIEAIYDNRSLLLSKPATLQNFSSEIQLEKMPV